MQIRTFICKTKSYQQNQPWYHPLSRQRSAMQFFLPRNIFYQYRYGDLIFCYCCCFEWSFVICTSVLFGTINLDIIIIRPINRTVCPSVLSQIKIHAIWISQMTVHLLCTIGWNAFFVWGFCEFKHNSPILATFDSSSPQTWQIITV